MCIRKADVFFKIWLKSVFNFTWQDVDVERGICIYIYNISLQDGSQMAHGWLGIRRLWHSQHGKGRHWLSQGQVDSRHKSFDVGEIS